MEKLIIIVSFIFFAMLIHPMEAPKKHMATPRHTTPKYKEQLIQAKEDLTKDLAKINSKTFEEQADRYFCIKYAYKTYYDKIAKIANNANNMSKEEKLNCLIGNDRYQQRKALIISMITQDQIDPNTIIYQDKTPLDESIELNDIGFTRYLLRNGATPNALIIKKGKESSSQDIRNLFS